MKHLRVTQPIGFGWMASDLTEAGVAGDASKATVREGRSLRRSRRKGLYRLVARRTVLRSCPACAQVRSPDDVRCSAFRVRARTACARRALHRRRRRSRARTARRPGGRRGRHPLAGSAAAGNRRIRRRSTRRVAKRCFRSFWKARCRSRSLSRAPRRSIATTYAARLCGRWREPWRRLAFGRISR